MRVQLSRELVVNATLAPPAWYPFEVADVKHNQSDDGSATDEFTLKVIDGEFKGKTYRFWISEKYLPDVGLHFYEALLGIKISKDMSEYPEVDHDDLIGKRGMLKSVRGEFKNKPQDTIEDFRPLKAA